MSRNPLGRVFGLPSVALLFVMAGCASSHTSRVQPSGQTGPFTLSSVSRVVSGSVDGARGGTLRNGDWTLEIPAGSFAGVRVVTITVPEPGVRACELGLDAPPVGTLRAAATLSCRLQSTEEARARGIHSWDSGFGAWIATRSTADTGRMTCDAPITRLTAYRCGPVGA